MAIEQRAFEKPGVWIIGFSPVIRESLQAILTKDERLDVAGDVPGGYDGLLFINRAGDRVWTNTGQLYRAGMARP